MQESNNNSKVLPPSQHKEKPAKREALKSVVGTILILLSAPLLALLITAYVFQSYQVDGPSMQSTLEHNDRLIVWKLGRTWARITGGTYIPPRNTVIVFVKHGSYDLSAGQERQLIKRIIGLPGDTVKVANGTMRVYNSEHPDGFNPDENLPEDAEPMGEIVGESDITVKPGEVFVVGDHRDNSTDSRMFGTVPAKDIVGTLSARILPLSEAKKF